MSSASNSLKRLINLLILIDVTIYGGLAIYGTWLMLSLEPVPLWISAATFYSGFVFITLWVITSIIAKKPTILHKIKKSKK